MDPMMVSLLNSQCLDYLPDLAMFAKVVNQHMHPHNQTEGARQPIQGNCNKSLRALTMFLA